MFSSGIWEDKVSRNCQNLAGTVYQIVSGSQLQEYSDEDDFLSPLCLDPRIHSIYIL